MTEATFTKLCTSAGFEVVGSVGGPQTGSTADSATDCTESTKLLCTCTSSVDLVHQCTQLVLDSVYST